MSLAYFWIFLFLLAAGMPVVFALLAGPGLSLLMDGQEEYFTALLSRLYNGVDSFPLLAVPFFILAGELMNAGGITRALVKFSQTMLGHVRGGLAQVNVLSSLLFAGISGSAVADATAIGKMLVPEMERNGYRRSYAAAVTSAAAIMGPIIPPSGIMILYGFVMNVSVGALFAAGIVPGLLIAAGLMTVTSWLARRRGFPPAGAKASWPERATAFRGAIFPLMIPVLLLGGLRLGIFTTTEAAAVTAAFALFVAMFLLRALKWRDVPHVLTETAVQSGVILLLVGTAVTFAWIVTVSGLAERIATGMLGLSDNVYLLLFMVNLLLFVVGMFLDAGPAILILGPVLAPIFTGLGVDPVHFAIIMCVNVTIGLATPPMGLLLFVASAISGERMERIIRDLLPYLAMLVAIIFVITYVPAISLWLPRAIGLM
jgi:tripartite ATP-independent transporter DctM subunit